MSEHTGFVRTRWAAIGAAVAVTLGAGTIATVDAVQSSGERLTYVASDPCRLMNTRPGTNQVGPRTTPLPEGTPVTVDARGAQGNCTAAQLPNDAVALQLNVTPVNATASTDITIWPTGPIPQASSVNPRPGPPVPNAVVATLHTDGTFQMQNKFGTIDMVIDVLGYFVDHNHDDRYYTEAEVDVGLDQLAETQREIQLPVTGAVIDNGASYNQSIGTAGILLPDGGSPAFAWSFVIPADYVADSDLEVVLSWIVFDDTCEVTFRRDFVGLHRTGVSNGSGFLANISPTPSLGNGVGTTTTFVLDDSVADFQPGDAINVGFFRSTLDDTCTGNAVLNGAIVRY